MDTQRSSSFLRRMLHRLTVLFGAASLTTVFFLVLPLIQAITEHPVPDTLLTSVDTASLPQPPDVPEEEPEPEEAEEEEPPELAEESQPLDLAQLELVLNPGFGGSGGGEFVVDLGDLVSAAGAMDDIIDAAGLDTKPRPIYQPGPTITPKLRKIRSGGTVVVLIIIDEQGKVRDARVESSTDKRFERPALSAVRKWKYEPAKRNGKPTEYRMRKPITFPKQG